MKEGGGADGKAVLSILLCTVSPLFINFFIQAYLGKGSLDSCGGKRRERGERRKESVLIEEVGKNGRDDGDGLGLLSQYGSAFKRVFTGVIASSSR